jgi:hypothetical protein
VPENDWIRFDFYAKRVTRFKPGCEVTSRSARYSSSFLCFLSRVAAARPSNISFPRLRELSLAFCGTLQVIVTAAAMPASLRKLTLTFGPPFFVGHSEGSVNPHQAGDFILRDAACHAPQLEHISIVGSLSATLITSISQFSLLRGLDLTNVTGIMDDEATRGAYHHLLHALSMSDHLLELRLPRALHAEHIPQCSGFAYLETLHLGDRLFTSSRFISIISSDNLCALTIHPAEPAFRATQDEWRVSLEELRLHCGISLRHLSLHATIEVNDTISLIQFLQPLTKLSDLESIALNLPLEATDETLHKLALAWPKMKSFQTYCRAPNPNSKFCTIRCLDSFTQLCPDLVSLAIRFDHKGLADIPDTELSCSRHGLKNLDLVTNQVQDYRRLASIVDAAFPMLEHVAVRNTGPRDIRIPANGLLPGVSALQKLRCREDVPRFLQEFRNLRNGASLVLSG